MEVSQQKKTPAKTSAVHKPAATPSAARCSGKATCAQKGERSAFRSPYVSRFETSLNKDSTKPSAETSSATKDESSACHCSEQETKNKPQPSTTQSPSAVTPSLVSFDMSAMWRALSSQIERFVVSTLSSQVSPTPTAAQTRPALASGGGACPTSKAFGGSGNLDLLFAQDSYQLNGANRMLLDLHSQLWVLGGLSDNVHIDGYASTDGARDYNLALSCLRAQSVRKELQTLGLPATKLSTLAHGETNGFSAADLAPNRRAVIKRLPGVGPSVRIDAFPFDNFGGRSNTMLGLREWVRLGYRAVPGIAAAERLGLRWSLVQGGDFVVGPAMAGIYRAPATPQIVIVALQVAGGLAVGKNLAMKGFLVIPPISAIMQQRPGSAIYHHTGWASVGFRGDIYFRPTTVSFSALQFAEGGGVAVADGIMANANGRGHTPSASWVSIGPGNAATGNQLNSWDCVGNWRTQPGSLFGMPDWRGNFHWPIEWRYLAPGGSATTFMIAHHIFQSDILGTASVRKAGAGPFFSALAAPTQLLDGCDMMP